MSEHLDGWVNAESLEFAVNVGCVNNCSKYCPQEVVLARYKGSKFMLFCDFKKVVDDLPKDVNVIFAGVAEPFSHPEIVDFVLYAHSCGHKIGFYTTLVGAEPSQIKALAAVPFERFVLHMPDLDVLKLPFDHVRAECEHLVWSLIGRAEAMSFNDWFRFTNGREHISRGVKGKPRRVGYCVKLRVPQMMVYPNGDTYLCCTDFGLEHKLGNLLSDGYNIVRSYVFALQPFDLCRYCKMNVSLKRYYGRKAAVSVKNFLRRLGLV